MEALAALGLASNIISFVDFGSKLVKTTAEAYISASGSSQTNEELESLTEDLGLYCEELESSRKQLRGHVKPLPEERQLASLAASCADLAIEFQAVLNKLKVQGRKTRWKSVKQALRSVWSKDEIEQYNARLDRYRAQVTLRIVGLLTAQNERISQTLDQLVGTEHIAELSIKRDLESMKNSILASIKDQLHQEQEKEPQFNLPVQVVREYHYHGSDEDFKHLGTAVSALLERSMYVDTQVRIIKSLLFSELETRHDTVAKANTGTFDWMVDENSEPGQTFLEWARSDKGMYWITGKPGSGKSTLMKYVCQDQDGRVKEALKKWAGDRTLSTARFFFWASGTKMEKSQIGLLQSLLYQILRQCPDLAQVLLPEVWEDSKLHGKWTLSELTLAFKRFKALGFQPNAFCFFVDGMDEFEGEHADLIATVNDLVTRNVKLCFSSRPWNVFEDAYNNRDIPKLIIHEHTKHDIARFIKDQLEENHKFVKKRLENARYEDLVYQITERAAGVFLWVYLVTRSLIRGLTNADTIEDLQRRLDALPTDLKDYFRFMLDSVEEVYREHSCRIYMMCIAAEDPLYLQLVCLFDENDPLFGAKGRSQRLAELLTMKDGTSLAMKRLQVRCQDLLQIRLHSSRLDEHDSGYRVDFLHRTARDFLESEDIYRFISDKTYGFDANNQICQAVLAYMQYSEDFPMNLLRIFGHHATAMDERGVPIDRQSMLKFVRLRDLGDGEYVSYLAEELYLITTHGLSRYLEANLDQIRYAISLESEPGALVEFLVDIKSRKDSAEMYSKVLSIVSECSVRPNPYFGQSAQVTLWERYLQDLVSLPYEAMREFQQRTVQALLENGVDKTIYLQYAKRETSEILPVQFVKDRAGQHSEETESYTKLLVTPTTPARSRSKIKKLMHRLSRS